MKRLLASCSFFAASLCYIQSQAQQSQIQLPAAPGKHSETRRQFPLYSETQIGTKMETSVRVWPEMPVQVSPGTEVQATPEPGIKARPGVLHRHLLVAKVPESYNGHLLIKTPDKKMRHLRVFPNPDTPGSKMPDIAKFFLISEKSPENDRSAD